MGTSEKVPILALIKGEGGNSHLVSHSPMRVHALPHKFVYSLKAGRRDTASPGFSPFLPEAHAKMRSASAGLPPGSGIWRRPGTGRNEFT